MTCADTTLSLGAYLLGSLEPAERDIVEAHLAGCALCQAELAELAALPSMLDKITLDDFAPEPITLSEDLFERVAAQVRAEAPDELAAKRSRYRRLLAVAAALVVLAGGGIGTWAATHGKDVYTNPGGRVHMSVSLASQTAGTELAVHVSNLPVDEHCKLIAISKDGTRDVAGRWWATYQGVANVTGSTSIPRSQLSQLVLFGTNGEKLATVHV